jgi:hypothetical protein
LESIAHIGPLAPLDIRANRWKSRLIRPFR